MPSFVHQPKIKPPASSIELGRGADGVVIEVADHPEFVIKQMNHPLRLGQNRVRLEQRVLHQILAATDGLGATEVLNSGMDNDIYSWLVRERVFDVFPRGDQPSRERMVDLILRLYPSADINRLMLADPTFDNLRWGYTARYPEPRWILIDP